MRARTKLLITICAVAALTAAGAAAVAASGSPGASSGPKKNKSEILFRALGRLPVRTPHRAAAMAPCRKRQPPLCRTPGARTGAADDPQRRQL